MNYLIGEFSRRIGVSIDTLKHYESLKIIKPQKNKNNNYRYFNDYDARAIITSRTLRSLNLPLNDVVELMNSDSPSAFTEKLKESKEALQDQIYRKTLLLKKIDEFLSNIAQIDSSLGKFATISLPGIYRLQHTNKDKLLKNPALEGIVNSWMDALPFTFSSFKVNTEEYLSGLKDYHYNWGQAVWENELDYADLQINGYVEYIPPQTYLSTILSETDHNYFLSNSRPLIKNYLRENEYVPNGDILGMFIFTHKKRNRNVYYLKVFIPIEVQ